MKLQACEFRRKVSRNGVEEWEVGVAAVVSYGDKSVFYIIDSKGDKLKKEPYDWNLIEGPLKYLNTEYRE